VPEERGVVVAGTPVPVPRARLYPVTRRHLEALTGELGVFQRAIGARADPDHGYRVDDVARALEVDLLHARVRPWSTVAASAWRGLRFLEEAFDPTTGHFGHVRASDGTWLIGPRSDDASGRAMHALAQAIAEAPDPELTDRASGLFDRALPMAARLTSPRGQASLVLACAAAPNPARTAVMRTLATNLHVRFTSFARPGWPWPEAALTHENALLPQAMIVAGSSLGATTMVRIGLQVLDWLIAVQTEAAGHLSPIGDGTWPHGGSRSRFDQRPIEATALLLASEAAFTATRRTRYRDAMERAYGWFLGRNDLGLRVVDPIRGAGRDGLTPHGVDANEGAESTLMWLMAVEHIRAIRPARVPKPPQRDAAAPAASSRRGAHPRSEPTLPIA
jgi:hypothetical protein